MIKNKITNKSAVHFVIALLIGGLIKVCIPVSYDLTPVGITYLAVFIPTIYLWLTCSTDWPSVLAIAALCLLGVYPSTTLYASAWGQWVFAYAVGCYVLTGILVDTGAVEYIAKWFVTRKMVENRPKVFLLMLSLGTFLVGCFVSNVACLIIFIALIKVCSEIMGIKKGEPFYNAMFMLSFWASSLGQLTIPFGKSLASVILGIVSGVGYEMDYGRFFTMSVPFSLAFVAISWVVVCFIYRPDVSKFSTYDPQVIRDDMAANPINRRAKTILILYIFVLFSWIAPLFTFLPKLSAYFKTQSYVSCTWAVVALCCVIKVDGKPMCNLGQDIKKIQWAPLLFLITILSFSAGIGSADFGISTTISAILAPVFDGLPTYLVICLIMIMVLVLTNVMSNAVALTIIMTAMFPIVIAAYEAGTSPYEPLFVAGVAGLISNCAFITPAATVTAPLVFTDDLDKGVGAKVGIYVAVAILIFTLAVFMPLGRFLWC